MTEEAAEAAGAAPNAARLQRAAAPLVPVLLATQALRLVVAVVAGILASRRDDFGTPHLVSTGDRIAQFGTAGDGLGTTILLLAVVVLWWQSTDSDLGLGDAAAVRGWRRRAAVAAWLLALSGLSSLLAAIGFTVEASAAHFLDDARAAQIIGFSVAYVVLAAGGVYVVRRLLYATDEIAVAATIDGEAAVFAVDRQSGDVLAWATMRDAVEQAPVYGVEEDEYEFFLDDGTVLAAGVDDEGQVQLRPTEAERFDDLVRHLQEYAGRHELAVDPGDDDEPLAYVDLISRRRWLEMWPGWLRWAGRLARPPR